MYENVKAAMERWRGDEWGDTLLAMELADAFVALYDETPITPEWLTSIRDGTYVSRHGADGANWIWSYTAQNHFLQLGCDGDLCIEEKGRNGELVVPKITTRGQLLRLLSALGVE